MPTKNEITGDEIKSKALSAQGRKNFDRIFVKKTFNEWAVIENFPNYSMRSNVPINYQEFKKQLLLLIPPTTQNV